ncbi:MAG TPA: hypothetical protein VFE51_04560 [Verrucomicrobiae bacterium]|nr:hypothetical protein [Verrucomicrobiae bacterium]
MRGTKIAFFLAALLLAIPPGFTQSAFGYLSGITNPPPVTAQVHHEEGPGLLPADRVYVTIGAEKFAFLVPAGYKLEQSSGRVVTMATADYSCQIAFRLAGPMPADGGELNPGVYSAKVMETFPGAAILRTFSAFAEGRQGPAFEIQLTGAGGAARRGKLAFIPSRTSVLQFSLTCSPEKFEEASRQLNTVMLTFRASDAQGELHVSPLSDKL